MKTNSVNFIWLKAHNGNMGNSMADYLANSSANAEGPYEGPGPHHTVSVKFMKKIMKWKNGQRSGWANSLADKPKLSANAQTKKWAEQFNNYLESVWVIQSNGWQATHSFNITIIWSTHQNMKIQCVDSVEQKKRQPSILFYTVQH